ncbi:unnamed protein product [Lactuca saligna]|uniref:Uncharacterized protein n=1 Tax=Lactuca saligna TaxID=75948 RepID=A0AA36EDH6_LACSI|nr:unnamed protein product [Lactuca saligna]
MSVNRMDEKQRVCGIQIKKGLLGRRSSVETIVLLELETWKWKKLRFRLSTIAPILQRSTFLIWQTQRGGKGKRILDHVSYLLPYYDFQLPYTSRKPTHSYTLRQTHELKQSHIFMLAKFSSLFLLHDLSMNM